MRTKLLLLFILIVAIVFAVIMFRYNAERKAQEAASQQVKRVYPSGPIPTERIPFTPVPTGDSVIRH